MGRGGEIDDVEAHVARRLVPFLILLYFFAFLDRVNVGFAALTMNAELGLSAAAYGFGAGIFFIGYVLFEVPSNLLLERYGARVWIARILITWGLVSAATAFVQGPKSFYVARLLLGFAEAGFFPGIIHYLGQWFPPERRARIVAMFLVALPLSSVIGAPLSTALLSIDWLGHSGWRWMFVLEAVPTIALGFVTLRVLIDKPGDTRGGQAHDIRAALLEPRAWLHGFVYFGIVVGVYGFGFWLPQIVGSLANLSRIEIGLLSTVPYALAAIAMIACGRDSDATGERDWHVAGPALAGAVALAVGAAGLSPELAFIALCCGAAGIYAALPPFWALAARDLRGVAAAGTIALVNSIGNLGGFVGPILIGQIKQRTGGFASSLLAIAAFLAVSAAIVIALRRPREA